jgi:hypothetical protein
MPFLLALPVFYCVALAHRYLQIYAPSNLLARSCPGSSGPITVADDRTDSAG